MKKGINPNTGERSPVHYITREESALSGRGVRVRVAVTLCCLNLAAGYNMHEQTENIDEVTCKGCRANW